MRTTILAIAAALVLVMPFTAYAKGGGGYICKTTAECEERQAARDKRAAEWKAEQAEQKAKDEAEEKAEQAKVKKALAAGLEQVETLPVSEREINAWLQAHPKIRIVRVVAPDRSAYVLIFYRNK